MKRGPSGGSGPRKRHAGASRSARREGEEESVRPEDPFVDDVEEEVVVGAEEALEAAIAEEKAEVEGKGEPSRQAWMPGMGAGADEGEMDYDSSAYVMFHELGMEWPCLSFDVVRDNLGAMRTAFPMTAFVVAGTQADRADQNALVVLRLDDLHRTRFDEGASPRAPRPPRPRLTPPVAAQTTRATRRARTTTRRWRCARCRTAGA